MADVAVDKSQHIPIFEKIGYSLADSAANFVFMSMILFQAAFYTDVMKLKPGIAGLIILVPRLWDAFFDPIMGITADRTRTRWGRFRPWILWTAIPWGIVLYLAYTVPGFEGGALVAYAVITNALLMTLYSANNMPYSALGGVMSADIQERATLNSFRFVAVNAAQFIVQGFTLVWVSKFAGLPTAANPKGDIVHGWSMVFLLYAIMCVVFFLITFATTKERVKPVASQESSVKQDWADLLKNSPWFVMCLMTLVHFGILAFRGGAEYQYYQQYADKQAMYDLIKPMGLTSKTPMFDKTAIDPAGHTLDLKGTHGLSTGQKVIYRHGYDDTEGLGGLKNGKVYFARVLPDKTVQLFDKEDHAKASGDAGLIKLKSVPNLADLDKQQLNKGDKKVSLKPEMLDFAGNSIASLGDLELSTGDKVRFDYQVPMGGLVDGASYYLNVGADGRIKLYDTKENAQAGGAAGLTQISNTGTGIQHELIPPSLMESLGYIVHAHPNSIGTSNVANAVYGIAGMLGKAVTILAIFFFAAPLAKRFGKKLVCVVGFALMIFNSLAFYFLGAKDIGMMILLTITGSLFYAPTIPLVWAIFADVADYSEWRTGRRATGTIFATIGFALKAGLAIGAYGLLMIQSSMNYDPDAVSPEVVSMFRVCTTIVPGILFAICTLFLIMYKLDKHTTEKIVGELAERRKASESGKPTMA
jgi:Na+/melibiose symporter-like transporter